MDNETVLAVVGGGFAAAASLVALGRARLSRSHRNAGDFLAWAVTAAVLAVVAVSLLLAPGAWVDAYGGVLRLLRGGE